MGKKGSWFSAIKRVFCNQELDKRSSKEKKKKRGIFRHGDTKSFIPLFRGPSSIEKILEEADEEKLLIRAPNPAEQPKLPPLLLPRAASPGALSPRITSPRVSSARAGSPRVTSPRACSLEVTSPRDVSPRVTPPKVSSALVALPKVSSPRTAPPKVASPCTAPPKVASPRASSPSAASSKVGHKYKEISYRPEPTLRYRHLSATKIQAAYRGFMARRSFKALKGLVRLQTVVRGQNVKRQTMHAMKMMQLLVRVQTQIQSRRIQMLENQARQRQAYKNDKEYESSLGKWTSSKTEAGLQEEWDDSLLTKEEVEARLHKKVEAIIKRERAMAYGYSHQLWKANPKSDQTDIRFGGFPWWWNWLDRQLPLTNPPESQSIRSFHPTPLRPTSDAKPSPQPSFGNYRQHMLGFDTLGDLTPRSTRSAAPLRTRTPSSSSTYMKYSKPRTSPANSAFDLALKDDDSLTSCPPFSVPNYMTPTFSTKAKVRTSSNPKDRFPGTPSGDSKRRLSFPLTPDSGSFKWNKGSSKNLTPQRELEKHQSLQSIGDLSIDSAVSMPAAVGRKPFNRFV